MVRATNVRYDGVDSFHIYYEQSETNLPTFFPIADSFIKLWHERLIPSTCKHYIKGTTYLFNLNLEHNYYHFHHNNMIRLYQSMIENESQNCAPAWNDYVNETLIYQMISHKIIKDNHLILSGRYNNLQLWKSLYPKFSNKPYFTIDQIPQDTCFENIGMSIHKT